VKHRCPYNNNNTPFSFIYIWSYQRYLVHYQQLKCVTLELLLALLALPPKYPLNNMQGKCSIGEMKRTRKVKQVEQEEEVRAYVEEINLQLAPEDARCSSGWPQNSTIRVFTDIVDAFDYGIELKKQGKLLPRECNVNIFDQEGIALSF
jgi:hypothetical protein